MKSIIGINKEALDQNQYLASLINEGMAAGLVGVEFSKSISFDLMEIFKEVMRMYTRGESTTLKAETAEGLMQSIVYSLDLYLMKYSAPEDAILHLRSSNTNMFYKEAIEYVKHYIEETKNLYRAIETKRIIIPNVVYNETFTKAIPDFFANYDVIFSAQDTSTDIDYPLVFDDMSIKGIMYIRRYLEAFQLENEFCRKFNPSNITALLEAYGKFNRLNYEQSPINIFELIFNNIVFLTLLDKNKSYENLFISAIEFEMIEEQLNRLEKSEIKNLISEGINRVMHNLEINSGNLRDLIYRYSDSMMIRLENALEHGNLRNMVILEVVTQYKEQTVLEIGYRMDNKAFRFVYRKIMDCSTAEDKMILLAKYVHSLGDFVDLLKADCFYEKEYDYVFGSLGNLELSTLITSELKEYILRGEDKLSVLFSNTIVYKYAWEKALIDWLRAVDKSRLQDIELLVHKNLVNEIV
ncbi:hypothetical protein SAMN05446037_1004132 [Anaerovirgula multivorans]|uniref:Uncharacterized protein n=1 Tax=Anaerovirgula multivorans TaxID=312168 RepID=A0A239BTB7_9FIRM|nr:DUF6179 domain-containing protein [Anaerovirgula multivorans]SNS11267.1 hypothetical protein SAMN05446037_1004132 [Anaerovirgula multivorans]